MFELDAQARPIAGYEGRYSVTANGIVISHARRKNHRSSLIYPEMIMRPVFNNYGYHTVTLCKNGTTWKTCVHRLVASAFLTNPNPESYTQINHKNGVKTDNRAENLEWCDHSGNMRHAYDTGLVSISEERIRRARDMGKKRRLLTMQQANDIRALHAAGSSAESLAPEYGVCAATIYLIVSHKTYQQ